MPRRTPTIVRSRHPFLPLLVPGFLAAFACSSNKTDDGTGGKPSGVGGATTTASQGGLTSSSGGTSSSSQGGTTATASGGVSAGGTTAGGGVPTGGSSTATGGSGTGGSRSSGGTSSGGMSSGGAPSSGGTASGGTASGGAAGNGSGGTTAPENENLAKFSFFLTSVGSMRDLAKEFGVGDQGFGGDLRYGEATGLAGADKICRTIAERAMPGAGKKNWRAFLSATKGGPNDGPVHAKDRVGTGPWYDAAGRIVAMTITDLLQDRPRGAHPQIINDLPNENGIPNHTDQAPGCTGNTCPDNHQVLTGTNEMGMLYSFPSGQYTSFDATCHDWSTREPIGRPWCGHSWPRMGSGTNWMSSYYDGGCAPCISIVEMGGVREACVGSAGGYGGFYCLVSNAP